MQRVAGIRRPRQDSCRGENALDARMVPPYDAATGGGAHHDERKFLFTPGACRAPGPPPPGNPFPPSAPTTRRHPADRNTLEASAAYSGEVRSPSCAARAFIAKGISAEPTAKRGLAGLCSPKGGRQACLLLVVRRRCKRSE